MTPIDIAHARMQSAPEDDAARLAFYERVAEAELVLVLETEAAGDTIEPRLFTLRSGPVAAAFDSEERLAEFAGSQAHYAALPGRRLVAMLAGQGIALGLNLSVAPSAFLMPPDAVDWFAATLAQGPAEDEARIAELTVPRGLPEPLLTALDRKLARAAGLAACAYLVGVTYGDGRRGHLLALIDANPDARPVLAAELAEALTFSGLEAGEMDVGFFAATDPIAARLARMGLRFDLPEAVAPEVPGPPGMDPDRPPRLK